MKNITLIRVSAFALISIFLSGCFGNQIKPEIKKQINTTEVQVIIKQPEIYGSVVRNQTGGAFGILGAIAAENSKEERMKRNAVAIKPVVTAMKGYKVKSLAQRAYDEGLRQVGWMKPGKVKLVNRELPDSERYTITRNSKADAVLFVEVDYRLNDTFKAIEIESRAYLYREIHKEPGINPEVVYRNFHTFKWELPNNADGLYDHEEIAKKWSEQKAALLKEKIKEGLDIQAKQLAAALLKS